MRGQSTERRLLVLPHEAAIAEHVGAEYGGELALHDLTPRRESSFWLLVLSIRAVAALFGTSGGESGNKTDPAKGPRSSGHANPVAPIPPWVIDRRGQGVAFGSWCRRPGKVGAWRVGCWEGNW